MEEISIHDNFVTGYTVLCSKREITLHTEFRSGEQNERTDVCFHGVEAYLIIRDNMGTILFDIEESTLEQITRDYLSEFEKGMKWGWPGPWNNSVQACLDHFRKEGCKGWPIDSSYGMAGFVIAKNMELKSL